MIFTDIERTLFNVPDEKWWRLYTKNIDRGLYLVVEKDHELCVRSGFDWSYRRKIPQEEELDLNNDIISEVHKKIMDGETDINMQL